jgi:hypothetical protein
MRITRFDDNLVGVVLDDLEPVDFSAWDEAAGSEHARAHPWRARANRLSVVALYVASRRRPPNGNAARCRSGATGRRDVGVAGTRRNDVGGGRAKAVLPTWARTAFACKNYCFLSLSFAGSGEVGGVLAGAPAPAAALLPLVEPLAAGSFFSGAPGAGAVLTEPEAEPDGAVDGLLGVVVEPAEEDAPPGGVVRETARSPSLSQPVSNPAPSAKDTATAKVESLIMWASMVGVGSMQQGLGQLLDEAPSHHCRRQLPAARMAD